MAVDINCLDNSTGTSTCVPCRQDQRPDPPRPNPGCVECSPISPICGSVADAVCTPIIGQRIYDCVCIEKEQNSYLQSVSFTIDGNTAYGANDPICIQTINETYNFIGLDNAVAANKNVIIDGIPHDFSSTLINQCGNRTLFRGLNQTLALDDRCCCLTTNPAASQARIIETNREFLVCGLKITIAGRIGSQAFTASSTIFADNPISINDLGFNDVTFIGRICLPTGTSRNVSINETFDSCLRAEAIAPRGPINTANRTFNAAVELSFKVNKKIQATVEQQLAVWAARDPQPLQFTNGAVASSCPQNCPGR